MKIALAIHGGAWNIPDDQLNAHTAGIATALHDAWSYLQDGASALKTVERAVRLLEDDPTFNAGRGAHLNRVGSVELDASIMNGLDLAAGAVAAIEGVRHPISVAAQVMHESPHTLLVARGALEFARKHGAELCRTRDLLIGRERERYLQIRDGDQSLVTEEFVRPVSDHHGTVGAVALDTYGSVAAATSTGGTQDKYRGRVGDSPLIGSGTYADNLAGAASCTGEGEAIVRVVLAKGVVDRLRAGNAPESAAQASIATLVRVGGQGGVILVDRNGGTAATYNTPRMARGMASAEQDLWVGVDHSMHRANA